MDPITALAVANAAISLAETLIPQIRAWVQSGEINAEQQAELLRRYTSLKAKTEGQFVGKEWEVTK